jgi:MFS family permease
MESNSQLRRSLVRITVAGCLAMVYSAGISSPAFVDFMRVLGATDFHFGLIGGIPMIMLALQFAGATITNTVHRRKPWFMVLVIFGRLLYLPLAFLPALVPSLRGEAGIWFVLALLAVSGMVLNLAVPMWLSWMADLVPGRILNTYWGRRQFWMYLTWAGAFLAISAITFFAPLKVFSVFPALVTIAVIAGVVDILLFKKVMEPPNMVSRHIPVVQSLMAPFRSKEYRSFLIFSCAWSATAMFAAAFMQPYTLENLHVPVWQATLFWCISGVGVALVSSQWGRLADRFGHRPVLAICIGMKSLIVLMFFLVTPASARWVLPIVLFVDSFWNAGTMVATNGYMLKIAPRENRSMFIAAITGFAGICGGLGAIAGGAFLNATQTVSFEFLGRIWDNYSLLFAISIVLRIGCAFLAYRVKEPTASSPEKLLLYLLGTWPMRLLLFPVGLYRVTEKSNHNRSAEDKNTGR